MNDRHADGAGLNWGRLIPEIVAFLVMATVLLFVRHQFRGLVEPALLNAWLAFMAGCVAARVASVGYALTTGKGAPPAQSRGPGGPAITLAFCAGIVASVWILMPAADPLLRLVMIILCMWFIAMVIILNPDRWSVFGSLAVVASMASFALVYRLPYAIALAGFLVMEGVALVMIRRMTLRSAKAMQAALAIVQAERDAKTRFIASASHDLQQPLEAARLYFDQAVACDDRALRARAIAGARAAFASTQKLLESMLDHLRLEAGALAVRPEPCSIRAALDLTAIEHEPSARAAGIRIRVAGDASAMADAQLVRRILGNLVANAVQHAQGRRVLLAARRRGAAAEAWVIDDGAGVRDAEADRLFEDYFQGPTRARGGFGLGLATARRMAAEMDGSLELDRRWRGGCAFVLRLPAAPSADFATPPV